MWDKIRVPIMVLVFNQGITVPGPVTRRVGRPRHNQDEDREGRKVLRQAGAVTEKADLAGANAPRPARVFCCLWSIYVSL